jgi:hypothetical protein
LVILNFDDLEQLLGLTDKGAVTADVEEYGQERYYPIQDSLYSSFEDLGIDIVELPLEITRIVSTKLRGFNWNNEFQEGELSDVTHNTIFAGQFPPDQGPVRKWVIITFSNCGGNFYHAASGRASLFEFQKTGENWLLTKSFLAFGYGSDWGDEPEGCELVRIGRNNKYAAILHTSYSGNGGHDLETKTVYMEVDGVFEPVFDFTVYESYNGYPDRYASEGYWEMRIIESHKAYFDIATKNVDADWRDREFGVVSHFVYNGESYVENPCWLYTDVPVYTKEE